MIRYPWMRRIRPKLRNRRCSGCGREYASWLGILSLTHSTAARLVFLWVVFWTAAVILLLTYGVKSFFRLRGAAIL